MDGHEPVDLKVSDGGVSLLCLTYPQLPWATHQHCLPSGTLFSCPLDLCGSDGPYGGTAPWTCPTKVESHVQKGLAKALGLTPFPSDYASASCAS